MASAQEIYEGIIRDLPVPEKLRLAALILEDLRPAGKMPLSISDSWSDEDIRDLLAHSKAYYAQSYPDEEELG